MVPCRIYLLENILSYDVGGVVLEGAIWELHLIDKGVEDGVLIEGANEASILIYSPPDHLCQLFMLP